MSLRPFPGKLSQAVEPALWELLGEGERRVLLHGAEALRLSFQQLRQAADWFRDAAMWKEPGLLEAGEAYLRGLGPGLGLPPEGLGQPGPGSGDAWGLSGADGLPEPRPAPANAGQAGDGLFRRLREAHRALAGKAKAYPAEPPREALPAHRFEEKELKGRIFRLCPAASEKAVCCNLKVLNIVDNCAMACSYCVLQNHYDEAVVAIPTNLKEKLAEVKLNPAKRYRIGTGEYSDSLLWGNKNGLLEDLCGFARENPNAIVELKTKSANIAWLLENEVPANICCSWSLNPQAIISHEEHKTAPLDRRLAAARALADKGVRVGFHLHPMFYFEGYEAGYRGLAERLLGLFRPGEVLWISLGCVTLLKGFAKDFRLKFSHSKLLQMDTEITPDGKITYAFPVRERLYANALEALSPWRGEVFQYLCMEHKPMWDAVMGFAYGSMGEFDDAFNESAFPKLGR